MNAVVHMQWGPIEVSSTSIHNAYVGHVLTVHVASASYRAKINLRISLPFSYRFRRIKAVFTRTGN